eukprot:364743-Chlamydomonas_euryale.AAC.65
MACAPSGRCAHALQLSSGYVVSLVNGVVSARPQPGLAQNDLLEPNLQQSNNRAQHPTGLSHLRWPTTGEHRNDRMDPDTNDVHEPHVTAWRSAGKWNSHLIACCNGLGSIALQDIRCTCACIQNCCDLPVHAPRHTPVVLFQA